MTDELETTFRGARFRGTDFRGATFRECDMRQVRIVGSEIADLYISGFAGQIQNLIVNDVDVTAFVEANSDRIELFFLPPYAPEHNPDEYLNNDLKQAMARRRTPKTRAALKSGLTNYMRGLQKRPAKVKAFFRAPDVRYAA